MMMHSHSLVSVCMCSVCFLMVSMGLMQKVLKIACNCENGELDSGYNRYIYVFSWLFKNMI